MKYYIKDGQVFIKYISTLTGRTKTLVFDSEKDKDFLKKLFNEKREDAKIFMLDDTIREKEHPTDQDIEYTSLYTVSKAKDDDSSKTQKEYQFIQIKLQDEEKRMKELERKKDSLKQQYTNEIDEERKKEIEKDYTSTINEINKSTTRIENYKRELERLIKTSSDVAENVKGTTEKLLDKLLNKININTPIAKQVIKKVKELAPEKAKEIEEKIEKAEVGTVKEIIKLADIKMPEMRIELSKNIETMINQPENKDYLKDENPLWHFIDSYGSRNDKASLVGLSTVLLSDLKKYSKPKDYVWAITQPGLLIQEKYTTRMDYLYGPANAQNNWIADSNGNAVIRYSIIYPEHIDKKFVQKNDGGYKTYTNYARNYQELAVVSDLMNFLNQVIETYSPKEVPNTDDLEPDLEKTAKGLKSAIKTSLTSDINAKLNEIVKNINVLKNDYINFKENIKKDINNLKSKPDIKPNDKVEIKPDIKPDDKVEKEPDFLSLIKNFSKNKLKHTEQQKFVPISEPTPMQEIMEKRRKAFDGDDEIDENIESEEWND